MPAKDQAAYMRDYRARQKRKEFKQGEVRAAARIMAAPDIAPLEAENAAQAEQIDVLVEEIKRLKQLLAQHHGPLASPAEIKKLADRGVPGVRDPYAEVRPVPKMGKKKK